MFNKMCLVIAEWDDKILSKNHLPAKKIESNKNIPLQIHELLTNFKGWS